MHQTTVFTVVCGVLSLSARARAAVQINLGPDLLARAQQLTLEKTGGSVCAQGLQWSNGTSSCIDVLRDPANCGRLDHMCFGGSLAGGTAMCQQGVCSAQCLPGYVYEPSLEACIDIATDPHNCGEIGKMCGRPLYALATCSAGQCSFSCQTSYVVDPLDPSKCTRTTPVPERKKRKMESKTYALCPSVGETACPIAGSASISSELARRLPSMTEIENSVLPKGQGGYECQDLQSSLENCGGCSSLQEGQDCTKIPFSQGVGCENAKCLVFSCEKGYQPALDGSACVTKAPLNGHARHGRRKKQKKRNLHEGKHSHDR